jgi:hypothetical protein
MGRGKRKNSGAKYGQTIHITTDARKYQDHVVKDTPAPPVRCRV